MEKLDTALQRRVWERVYGRERGLTPQLRQRLQQFRRRELENAKFYEAMSGHSRYAEAFQHMASQANEHALMIQQMLGGERR